MKAATLMPLVLLVFVLASCVHPKSLALELFFARPLVKQSLEATVMNFMGSLYYFSTYLVMLIYCRYFVSPKFSQFGRQNMENVCMYSSVLEIYKNFNRY